MITALDVQVGRIVAELDKKGLRDNTIIFFASDNGGATSGLFAQGAKSNEERGSEEGGIQQDQKPPASNAPFSGGKGSLREGGVRVPAFVNWPGKLKPGVVNEPLDMVDVMPTLLALAGGQGQPRSSLRRQGHMGHDRRGRALAARRHPHQCRSFRGAVRKGDWKLIKIALLPGKTQLFNLAKDPGETTDVAAENPEIVKDLKRGCWPTPRSRSPLCGSRRSRPSSATKVRRSSIRISISTTAGCHMSEWCCLRSDPRNSPAMVMRTA